MSVTTAFSHRLRVAHLNGRGPTDLTLEPDAAQRAAIAAQLQIQALPQLRMTARLAPAPQDAWELQGRLQARVVQPCVVTLDPVETALDEPVHRVFSPHAADPAAEDVEMPDPDIEPLDQTIDVGAVMVEALALALPEYPRAPGADLDAVTGDQGGDEADDTRRPFAGLADLLARKPDS
ncbi:DUF177 domain-containing protein [uncultured Paracoccus sp.]|uniref:YceD family protein n=1 Tax=uncultured Paracoccus sp. TaxID=189685 RepID=UPI002618316B|nr:DUF177 domain-containing protein [uncultured Paracoccus sp.]